MFFQIFDWSNLFFDQSKSCLKICVSLCLVRLIELVFRSIEHRESGFFKNGSWLFQKQFFSKVFQVFSLSPIQTWLHLSVFSFLIFSFVRFLSPNTGKTLLPFFLFLFSLFMHVHAFLIWGFQTMHNLGFLMIQAKFCVINHWVLLYIVIFMIFVGKFDQFGDLWKIKISRACVEPDLGILFNLV